MLPSLPVSHTSRIVAFGRPHTPVSNMGATTTPWQTQWQHCGQQVQQVHHHAQRQQQITSSIIGLVAMGLAALTHQLPVRNVSWHKALPTDWKTYARIGLGLVGVQQLNKAIQWQPPGWLAALQAMAVVVPLSVGLKKLHLPTLVVSGVLVAWLVQGSQWLKSTIQSHLTNNNQPQWSPWVGVGIMLATVPLAWKVVPAITTRLLRSVGKAPLAGVGATAAGITCIRGCTPGGVICLSELTEALTGVATTAHHPQADKG